MDDPTPDVFIEQAVRMVLADAAQCPTLEEADRFVLAVHAELSGHLSRLATTAATRAWRRRSRARSGGCTTRPRREELCAM